MEETQQALLVRWFFPKWWERGFKQLWIFQLVWPCPSSFLNDHSISASNLLFQVLTTWRGLHQPLGISKTSFFSVCFFSLLSELYKRISMKILLVLKASLFKKNKFQFLLCFRTKWEEIWPGFLFSSVMLASQGFPFWHSRIRDVNEHFKKKRREIKIQAGNLKETDSRHLFL